MNHAEVERCQEQILASVHDCGPAQTVEPCTGILQAARESKESDLTAALGDVGRGLKAFADAVDLAHPGLSGVCDGQLVGTSEESFSKYATDVLRIVGKRSEWSLSKGIVAQVKKVVTQHFYYEPVRLIDSPARNQRYVRFLAGRTERENARSGKQSQTVSLSSLFKKGLSYWEDHPPEFGRYFRNCNRYEKEIEEAQVRRKHFADHGLTSMACEIDESIIQLKALLKSEFYYGFNPIDLSSAAVIVAKMAGHSFELGTGEQGLDFATVRVNHKTFDGYNFCVGQPPEDWTYQPKVYPLHEVYGEASATVRDLIEFLEAFPEAGGRPIFDHFRVLVPGVEYPSLKDEPEFVVRETNGEIVTSSRRDDARRTLDKILIREKKVLPVLLGEVDGRHYFISFYV